MMLMNVADDAAHGIQLRRYFSELTSLVDIQQPGHAILTHVDALLLHEKTRITAVVEILFEAKNGDLVLIGFSLPWAELRAVAAFVAVRVEVQRLKAVVEPRYRNGDVGAVRADINAFAADVITFEAALRLLRDKGIAVVFINLSDSNGPFAAVRCPRDRRYSTVYRRSGCGYSRV